MSTVKFSNYQNIYHRAQQVYEKNEEQIMRVLWFVDIQHIGSTAIPGSITKGDVDLNVRVKLKDFEKAKEELEKLYEINQPENWTPNFASFKNDTGFVLPVGVQLTIIGSKSDEFVKLRDLLINNSHLLEEYNQMKLKYEDKDMDEYRKEKAAFFERLRKLV